MSSFDPRISSRFEKGDVVDDTNSTWQYSDEKRQCVVVENHVRKVQPKEVISCGNDYVATDTEKVAMTHNPRLKCGYSSNIVLLTNETLKAENAALLARPGKRKRDPSPPTEHKMINSDGSELNRNIPGMKNLFKVLTAATMRKADEFLNQASSTHEQNCNAAPQQETMVKCHGDCRLFSETAVDFQQACEILIGVSQISSDRINTTFPNGFRNNGTFLVESGQRSSISMNDGNGKWGTPSGKVRYYVESEDGGFIRADDGKGRLKNKSTDFAFKIYLKRYDNSNTKQSCQTAGRFQKKVYTAFNNRTKTDTGLTVLTYAWIGGSPWNFDESVFSPDKMKPTNWEKSSRSELYMSNMPPIVSVFYEGFTLYSHCSIDYNEAASILLGGTIVDSQKRCTSVPLGYRQNGTFVIDMKRMGYSPLELRRDDNGLWSKPSGFSRFYKFAENGDAVRVDRAGKLIPGVDYDAKVSNKRYENTQVDKKFVRKIYTVAGKNGTQFHGSPDLAVIVYYWKGDPIDFEPMHRQNNVHIANKPFSCHDLGSDEDDFVLTNSGGNHVCEDKTPTDELRIRSPPPSLHSENTRHMKHIFETVNNPVIENCEQQEPKIFSRNELSNQIRLTSVLNRAEEILNRLEHPIFEDSHRKLDGRKV